MPDGKILVVAIATISNQRKTLFIRYNSDGTLDSNYGTNGKVQLPIPYFGPNPGRIFNAARQPDGKIVIVGYDVFAFEVVPLVARFNEDGTLDMTFAQGNGISRPNLIASGDEQFDSVIIQPDGKILIYGGAESSSTIYPNFCLMRYNSDGSIDTNFGGSGTGFIVHTSIRFDYLEGTEFLFLQSNGKIVLSARRQNNLNFGQPGPIRRYNADGTVDSGFTPINFSQLNEIQTMFVAPDDKILIGGQTSKTESLERSHINSRIPRYNADGTLDTSFGNAGQASVDAAGYTDDTPKGMQVMPDGQILVAHNASIPVNRSAYRGIWLALTRLSANGAAVNGRLLVAPTNNNLNTYVKVQPDGKVLTAMRSSVWSGDGVVKLARASSVPLQNYVFHAKPFFIPNYSVYRPSTNEICFSSHCLNVGFAPSDILAPGDFFGDLVTEHTYFRPSTGTWHIVRSENPANTTVIRWGAEGDIPVAADYDGDGKADPAVFRPSDGNWYIYHIADGSYTIQHWGIDGDKPVVGDYDGDGKYDLAIYRPTSGEWWILRSSDGGYSLVQFGLEGDIPVQEDYDGDGKFDIAVYRPSNGVWYRINSSDASFFAHQWGLPGDVPVPGNYDSDGKANVAVWRPANGTWYIVNPDYSSMFHYTFGMDGDRPLPGRY